jgi:phospholipid/cholesterol/gamma-HCH transport system permease protein
VRVSLPADLPAAFGAEPTAVTWHGAADDWTLRLPEHIDSAAQRWPAVPAGLAAGSRVTFDGNALRRWDAALATELWALRTRLEQRGCTVDLTLLPAGLHELLEMAEPRDGGAAQAVPANAGGVLRNPWQAAMHTVAFFGDVLIALWHWLRGQPGPRAADVLVQLDQAGPRSLPIIMLTCALAGVTLAYMGGAQLGRIGAQGLLAGVVTVGMVRELAALMTGVILAGRIGSAFAAQLATMQAHEEVDALRVLGVDPVAHLVLPRLLALLLMAPALLVFGALAGVLAAWPIAVWAYGVTSAEYWQRSQQALTAQHLWIGLFKGMLYAALVALAGCREGLRGGRSAQAVGEAATAAVVKALVWIVIAASLTTVVFTAMGL